jgi:flagellin
MSSFINTNMVSLNTQKNLNKSQSALAQSIQRLSTGLRINSARDDASGSAIANRIESTIRGQTVAVRNTNDAISYSQYAEGALNQIFDNLQRMRELAVQSSNGVNGQSDRELVNAEFYQLQQEIDRIRNNTKFNGMDALSDQSFNIQTGAGTTQYDKITVQGMDLSKVVKLSSFPNAPKSSVTTFTRADFDKALAAVSDARKDKLFFNESNGHVYELVTTNKNLADATRDAETSTFGGASGYLATITNAGENAFVANKTGGTWTWINGNDEATEGTFVYGGTKAPETGAMVYKNFGGGEPNNSGNEDGVHLWGGGTWNDLNSGAAIRSVIEYGGTKSESTTSPSPTNPQVVVNGNVAWQVKDGTEFTVPGANETVTVATETAAGTDKNGAALAIGDETVPISANKYKVTTNNGTKSISYEGRTVNLTDNNTKVALENNIYKDGSGNFLTVGTKLAGGSFVYTATVAANGNIPANPNPSSSNLNAVLTTSQTAQSSDSAIVGNASGVNILTQADALDAINQLDAAMTQVNVAQIQQGATQNRLTAVISVLTSSTESLTNAKSHIMDTDYASETAILARNQIMQQAGIAMLAQANQLPNNIMTLLKG